MSQKPKRVGAQRVPLDNDNAKQSPSNKGGDRYNLNKKVSFDGERAQE